MRINERVWGVYKASKQESDPKMMDSVVQVFSKSEAGGMSVSD